MHKIIQGEKLTEQGAAPAAIPLRSIAAGECGRYPSS